MSELKIDYVTIHCSVTKDGENCDVSTIRAWHKERGFSDVGYHYVIQPDGEAQIGRPLNRQGAHVKGANRNNLGICIIGTNRFTEKAFNSLRNTLRTIEIVSEWKPWNLRCHNQWPSAVKQSKSCPNMMITDLMHWYLTESFFAIRKYLYDNRSTL